MSSRYVVDVKRLETVVAVVADVGGVVAVGLGAFDGGVDVEDLDDSDALVDRARERVREQLSRLNTVAARQVDEVLERLTGVVSMKVTPQLHALERAIYDAHQADAKGTRP